MKVLPQVRPTPEQLVVIQDSKPGVTSIRGAAGSGKTTTALLRLRFLAGMWLRRRARRGTDQPVRMLVLTYNRTLRGFISALAEAQVTTTTALELDVATFSKWSLERLEDVNLPQERERRSKLKLLGRGIPLGNDFLIDEVDYAMGRFMPESLEDYVSKRREGRGAAPRVDQNLRKRLLSEVVTPYCEWKKKDGLSDWNDLAVALAKQQVGPPYDVVVADEAQDFSANQVRAVLNHVAREHSATFILDAVQRIYPRFFAWKEVGVTVASSYRLKKNYRNSIEIARFALPLVRDLEVTDDGTLPDFEACSESGSLPVVLRGTFSRQMDKLIAYINKVDLAEDSVAILLPKGGHWFDYIGKRLEKASLDYVMITRQSDWPKGSENIALSTYHSAKGLEFDHVLMPGLNAEVTPHGSGDEDAQLQTLRRLVAMGIGRARKAVVLGYKPEDASTVIDYLDRATYKEVRL